MPLTIPAHQIAVLPLLGNRAGLPAGALLLGTALPDLSFVFGGPALNLHAHGALGPLVMAPTLGLALYLWGAHILAPTLATALPASGQLPLARLCQPPPATRLSTGSLALAALALLLGAYSHLLLDGFTHGNMWPARVAYPGARLAAFGLELPLSKALQLGLSALASIWVLIHLGRALYRAAPVAEDPAWRAQLGSLALTGLFGAGLGFGLFVALAGLPHGSVALQRALFSPALAGAFLGVSAVCLPRALQRARSSPSGACPLAACATDARDETARPTPAAAGAASPAPATPRPSSAP
ncbi:MAG: DUF4184 family protein [Deltaproteobacteria bacterium]|nr:DUF4184 family protein [Deltaproteobacteria bacterium]